MISIILNQMLIPWQSSFIHIRDWLCSTITLFYKFSDNMRIDIDIVALPLPLYLHFHPHHWNSCNENFNELQIHETTHY